MYHILEQHLDYKQGTINAIREYDTIQHQLASCEEQLANLDARLQSQERPAQEVVVSGSPKPDYRLEKMIDKKVSLEHDINGYKDYLRYFDRLWTRLEQEEQELLRARYGQAATWGIEWWVVPCREQNISRTAAYDRSNAALENFMLQLWASYLTK